MLKYCVIYICNTKNIAPVCAENEEHTLKKGGFINTTLLKKCGRWNFTQSHHSAGSPPTAHSRGHTHQDEVKIYKS